MNGAVGAPAGEVRPPGQVRPGSGVDGGTGPARHLRVTRRELVADGVVSLWLEPVDGAELPAWEPGAHIDLVLGGSPAPGESPVSGEDLVRQYSLCGDPADRSSWQIAVHLPPDGGRGGSRAVFERLGSGAEVTARGPRNAFALRPSPRYLFLAGGIGITPILPMLARAQSSGADWRLVYGGRTRAAMPFLDRLEPYGDSVLVVPQDEAGLPSVAEMLDVPTPRTLVYCCGPQPMIAAVEKAMGAWSPDSLVVERFGATTTTTTTTSGDAPFEVELARTGRVLAVPPGVSVLQALEDAGLSVLSSCRNGVCGSCEVEVLAGDVDHRDRLLTAEERAANDTMLICVSRSAGPRLVLGL